MILEKRREMRKKKKNEFFFFKQKTAYEIKECDWSSDVCSSDLIQAILRKCYDGTISKDFGNIKKTQSYEASFNILTAATPQIDRYFLYNQALGERYLNFRLQVPNRKALASVSFDNQFKALEEKQDKLKKRVHRFLRRLPSTDITTIRFTDEQRQLFIEIANFIALIRTRVTRDATGRYVTTLPQAELAGRLVKQMTQIAMSSAILNGETALSLANIEKAIYVTLCSTISLIIFIFYSVWQIAEKAPQGDIVWFTAQSITNKTAFNLGTIRRIIDDLAIHRILDIRGGKKQGGRQREYALSKEAISLIEQTGLFNNYCPPLHKLLGLKRLDRFRPTGTKHKKTPRKRRKQK